MEAHYLMKKSEILALRIDGDRGTLSVDAAGFERREDRDREIWNTLAAEVSMSSGGGAAKATGLLPTAAPSCDATWTTTAFLPSYQ